MGKGSVVQTGMKEATKSEGMGWGWQWDEGLGAGAST